MKKNILVLFFLLFSLPLFAGTSGLFIGEGKVFHAKTKYFDIIYCERSKDSAELLFYNADSIYEKIAGEYGHDIWFKMPVVVSPANEISNAYFSLLYYPHIVIYDSPTDEVTRNTNDDILSTFSHELTHAYTLQLKNGFWRGLDAIFGAVLNASGITITAGWTEGAAVMTESEDEIEGRLNDGWALQMLKQAKVEGLFPTYYDIQGADDKYPLGSYYYFNSFFNLWLKENYGMEKYSEFWWRCVNLKSITAGGAFKKVYGKKLKVAWKEFQDSIDTSDIKSASKKDDIFGFGEKGFVIESLVRGGDKIAFLEKKTKSVWCAELAGQNNKGGSTGLPTVKPKKLFTLSGIEKIAISTDGRYIVCDYTSSRHANNKMQIKIYDIEKKHFYELGETGLQDASILKTGEGNGAKYYLVALKFSSQKKSIVVKELNFKGSRLDAKDIEEFPQERAIHPYSFVDSGDGYFSYIEKSGMTWSIKTRSIEKGGESEIETFEIPDGCNIRYLARDEALGGLVFSWAEKNGFPKEGRIVFFKDGSHKMFFSESEESGGVYYPTGDFYVKRFYRESGVFKSDEAFLEGIPKKTPKQVRGDKSVRNDRKGDNEGKRHAEPTLASPRTDECHLDPTLASPRTRFGVSGDDSTSFVAASKRYNYFLYPKKGLFLPVGYFSSYETNPLDDDFLKGDDHIGAGAYYVTANPWGEGVFTSTAGYFFENGNYGAEISYSSGTTTSLFSYKIASQVEFNKTDFKENRNTVALSSQIPVFNFSNIILSNTAVFMIGENNLLYGKNTFTSALSTIHKTGMSIYEKSGFMLGASGIFEAYKFSFKGRTFSDDRFLLSPLLAIRIPRLIPIYNKDFYTYNLPLSISVQGFTGKNNYFSATAELCLFAREIEKAIPFFTAVFINRIMFSGGYNYTLFDENTKLRANFWNLGSSPSSADSAFLTFTLGATPNFGQAARNQLYMEFVTQFLYRIRKENDEKSNFVFGFSLRSNFF